LNKVRYASYQNILDDYNLGVNIYWTHRNSVVRQSVAGKLNIQVKINAEKMLIVSVKKTIRLYGMGGFYSHEEFKDLGSYPRNSVNYESVVHPPLLD
jgi:hypothetical protein